MIQLNSGLWVNRGNATPWVLEWGWVLGEEKECCDSGHPLPHGVPPQQLDGHIVLHNHRLSMFLESLEGWICSTCLPCHQSSGMASTQRLCKHLGRSWWATDGARGEDEQGQKIWLTGLMTWVVRKQLLKPWKIIQHSGNVKATFKLSHLRPKCSIYVTIFNLNCNYLWKEKVNFTSKYTPS